MRKWIREDDHEILFLTLTAPHDFGQDCAELMDTISGAYSSVFSGRPYRRDREAHGIAHSIRTWDATHGANGWHPHIHAILFVTRETNTVELEELENSFYARWARALEARGSRTPSRAHGIKLEKVRSADEIAGYVMKIEDSSSRVAMELTRGDLKTGWAGGGGKTPLEVLATFRNTGDFDELELWHEWEKATKGRQFSRWSSGAKEAMGLDELDDQELADAEVGGELLYELSSVEWHVLTGTPGAMAKALRITETHGLVGLKNFLNRIGERWRRRQKTAA